MGDDFPGFDQPQPGHEGNIELWKSIMGDDIPGLDDSPPLYGTPRQTPSDQPPQLQRPQQPIFVLRRDALHLGELPDRLESFVASSDFQRASGRAAKDGKEERRRKFTAANPSPNMAEPDTKHFPNSYLQIGGATSNPAESFPGIPLPLGPEPTGNSPWDQDNWSKNPHTSRSYDEMMHIFPELPYDSPSPLPPPPPPPPSSSPPPPPFPSAGRRHSFAPADFPSPEVWGEPPVHAEARWKVPYPPGGAPVAPVVVNPPVRIEPASALPDEQHRPASVLAENPFQLAPPVIFTVQRIRRHTMIRQGETKVHDLLEKALGGPEQSAEASLPDLRWFDWEIRKVQVTLEHRPLWQDILERWGPPDLKADSFYNAAVRERHRRIILVNAAI